MFHFVDWKEVVIPLLSEQLVVECETRFDMVEDVPINQGFRSWRIFVNRYHMIPILAVCCHEVYLVVMMMCNCNVLNGELDLRRW